MTFDSRNAMLSQEISPDWEPEIQEQWRRNQAGTRMGLLAELGTVLGEEKLDNYLQMGSSPWSVIFRHNELLAQVRSACAHGDFYPALVGACALGERLLNELLLVLRQDYINHPATTRRVRSGRPLTDWTSGIQVLQGWGVLDDGTAERLGTLAELRHRSVHFNDSLDAGARQPALDALHLVQAVIESVFTPHGVPPLFIADIAGASFLALASEQLPLVKRVYLPNSALLSPAHRMFPKTTESGVEWTVFDDADYDPTPLSDEEFAAAIPAGVASMHTDLGW